jgi:hypothetical protein
MKLFGLICLLLFVTSADLLAQPGPPPPDPDFPVPFQGLIYLIIAGAAFGVKKILGKQRKGQD